MKPPAMRTVAKELIRDAGKLLKNNPVGSDLWHTAHGLIGAAARMQLAADVIEGKTALVHLVTESTQE